MIAQICSNLSNGLQRLNLICGFGFLARTASFKITVPYFYDPIVDWLDSLQVMFSGIIIAAVSRINVGHERKVNSIDLAYFWRARGNLYQGRWGY